MVAQLVGMLSMYAFQLRPEDSMRSIKLVALTGHTAGEQSLVMPNVLAPVRAR